MTSPKRITVAICTYDRYGVLGTCIESLARQTLVPDEFEVLVVDNSPDPERSAAEAARIGTAANLRWIYEATPGLSNARNVATREAAAPVIAFIDDDATAEPDWLEKLLEAHQTLGPEFPVVGGRVLPVFSAPRPSWLSDRMLSYLSVLDLGEITRALDAGEWVVGANISYRVDVLREIGGFSPALGRVGSGISLMSNDETELADRLATRGWHVAYAGTAVVHHLVEQSRLKQEWFRRRMAWQAVSDFVRRPQEQLLKGEGAWRSVKDYLAAQEPHLRTQMALMVEQDDPGRMDWQLASIYSAVTCMLGATGDTDD